MTIFIAFVNQKGGAGKTTAALCVATELQKRNKQVLLVDADPQGTIRTFADVAGDTDNQIPTVVAMAAGLHRQDQLPALASSYDVAIIDCPPRLGRVTRSALMIANLAIIPCGPSPADTWALAETIELIDEAQILRADMKATILITRHQPRTAIGASIREALGESTLPVLENALGLRVVHQEALAAGAGVTQYAPRSSAAREVCALVDEIETLLI